MDGKPIFEPIKVFNELDKLFEGASDLEHVWANYIIFRRSGFVDKKEISEHAQILKYVILLGFHS